MSTTATQLDQRQLRDVFGLYPSGVVAVAGKVEGQKVGIAASSFTSVSIDPPLVSFSIAKVSNTWPALRRSAGLGISVLADHHDVICRQLAGPADRRFDGLPVEVAEDGAVLLTEGLATLRTRIHSEIEAGDHLIVLLEVVEVTTNPEREPLIFHRSGFKRLHRDDLDPSELDGRINGAPVPKS
ncbi:flavin reductase family protein [Nocardioides yefusunii]|uniref:Flavin reductase family protein n=1 Tax=Nocardioides yefusunii TaxID=2500546 RepID=A0ABW1QWQ3_9ACTN|nr:flavin reductase family protein [Nocardioides yefusunii]